MTVLVLKKWSGLAKVKIFITFLHTLCPVKEEITARLSLHVCGKHKRSKHELVIHCSSVCLILLYLKNILIVKKQGGAKTD